MPGAPFLQISDSYQGDVQGAAPVASGAGSHTAFLIWLVIIGVVIPAFILGGLKAGGFQFVFRRR